VAHHELDAVRRQCVSPARLLTTVGGAAVLCLGALWAVVGAHAAAELAARSDEEAQVEKRLDTARGIEEVRETADERRIDELTKTIVDGLAELRADVKTLLRR
jgi:hypothetical protein